MINVFIYLYANCRTRKVNNCLFFSSFYPALSFVRSNASFAFHCDHKANVNNAAVGRTKTFKSVGNMDESASGSIIHTFAHEVI